MIELLGEQRSRLLDATVDECDRRCVEVLRHDLAEQRCGGGGDLGGLEHNRVAGSERWHEGREQELDRVVPRRDDQHDAERLGHDLGRTRLDRELDLHTLRGAPRVEVLEGGLDLAEYQADLGRVRLHRWLAEVDGHRAQDRLLLLGQHPLQLAQLRAPGFDRAQHASTL